MPEDEEYIRSVQMGLMSPLSRSHGQATPREPWIFSETAQAAFLKINKLRYRLLPYLYSTAYETHNRGIPMMRARLLEFPQDRNVRTIGTEYMLGEAVLVTTVFDQQEHAVYLPKGSWIDLEREARLDGGWIVKEKRIDEIPLFLRENRGLFRLAEAPMHIADENFREITFVMNLTGRLDQDYFDDSVAGHIHAEVHDGVVKVDVRDVPLKDLVIYCAEPVRQVLVNGKDWYVESHEHSFLAYQGV